MPARQSAHRSPQGADAAKFAAAGALDHPTPKSIAAARAAQRKERDAFLKWTGIRLNHDGRPITSPRLVRCDDDTQD